MLWIIAIIVGIGCGVYAAYDCRSSWVGYIGWPFLTTLLSLILAILIGLFGAIFPLEVEDRNLYNTTEILAMKDDLGTEGWYRHVEQEGKYWVLIDTDRGSKMISYDANKTYIQKTSGQPRVEAYECIPKRTFGTFLLTKAWFTTTEYIIYIPEDAEITNEFVVDLE